MLALLGFNGLKKKSYSLMSSEKIRPDYLASSSDNEVYRKKRHKSSVYLTIFESASF
jgi:hypothetical protein